MTDTNPAKSPIRTPPDNRLWFVPLGGTGEIGMNLNVYGTKGKWLAVDMGVTFGDDSIPGVETVMADHIFLEEQVKDLAGIVITHAHEDHIGAVAYMWPDLRCPVYATPFAAAFLRHKLKEEGLDGEVPVHVVRPGQPVDIGPFNVEYIPVTHSIPEANILAIRTGFGTLVHTGDWKLDPAPVIGPATDLERLRRLGDEGVLAVVGDSTNILSEGHSGSEGEVRDSLVKVVGEFGGKVAIGCFASNVARLDSIIHAARANGREVCLVGRSLWRMTETARETGYLADAGPLLEADKARDLPDRKVLYICTGSQGEARAALSRIAWNAHPHVKLGKGDVCLFSSRVIPGNERAIFRMQNQLVKNGVAIYTSRERFIHVSGHPAREEVETLYKLLRPRLVVPVHGEARHLQEHADFALNLGAEQSIVLEDGDVVEVAPNGLRVVGTAPVGRLTIEGDRIVPMDSTILRDRKKMMTNGAAVVTLVMNGKGTLVGEPLITTHGLFNPEDEDGTDFPLIDAVRRAVDGLDRRDRDNDDKVREATRRVVRRLFNQDQGRKPLTDVHLVRL
jgi:ribonuclease J